MNDALGIGGWALITFGIAMMHRPSAVIFAGISCLAVAVALEMRKRRARGTSSNPS
jgi:hypothetical protein